MPKLPRHPQAKLYPSELVTIGILFALKGGLFRAFYCWLKRDYGNWFGDGTLLDRTRLLRLLKVHHEWCNYFLDKPMFFTVIDSFPIELIFPVRQGRSKQQVGKKGRDTVWQNTSKPVWHSLQPCSMCSWACSTPFTHTPNHTRCLSPSLLSKN